MSLEKCPHCQVTLQYIELDSDNTSLICPKCYKIIYNYTHVSVKTRIEQGYSRYVSRDESIAEQFWDNMNDEQMRF